MLHLRTHIFTTIACALVLGSCTGEPTEPERIIRLDRALTAADTPLTEAEQKGWDGIGAITGQTDREAYAASAAMRAFAPDVEALLPPLDSVGTALGRAKAAGVVTWANTYGFISPYSQSVVLYGQDVFVGLNHYLGADYRGYAGRFAPYLLHRKEARMIAPDVVMTLLDRDHPELEPTDSTTLLQRMLYAGARLYVTAQLLGTTPAAAGGFTPEEAKWWQDNEARIWRELIEAELLYNTDPSVADRLLYPAPASLLINANAPGQVALLTGAAIAESYARRHDITLDALLRPEWYRGERILIESAYSPR